MDTYQIFWTWAYTLGIGVFYVLVLAVIPLGFRDLRHLLQDLKEESRNESTD